MNKKQEQLILDYYITADKYIRSKTHSNAHQSVFTKESDTKQIVSTTLKKLNSLSEESCMELTATTKRRKLDTLVADYPDIYKLTVQDEVSKTYSFPKSHVSYRKPRTVSTEQREGARQMMIAKNKAKGD